MAEDLPDLRELITIFLLEQGYSIEVAKDGHEAVEMFSKFNPDLVVLDMRMPKMSGEDVCAEIRKVSDVPIVMFTSTNDSVTVKNAIKKGATDFVLKSSGMDALTERVAFHLANRPSKPAESDSSLTLAQAPAQAPDTGRQPIKITALVVEPDEKTRATIRAIITRLRHNVIETTNAAEAIAAFSKHKPNILITEWSLPDMDAFNMLSELKPTRRAKGVIKLMISARLTPEAHRKAQFVGFSHFFHKPLNNSKAELMVADSVRRAIRVIKHRASKAA